MRVFCYINIMSEFLSLYNEHLSVKKPCFMRFLRAEISLLCSKMGFYINIIVNIRM